MGTWPAFQAASHEPNVSRSHNRNMHPLLPLKRERFEKYFISFSVDLLPITDARDPFSPGKNLNTRGIDCNLDCRSLGLAPARKSAQIISGSSRQICLFRALRQRFRSPARSLGFGNSLK